MLAALTVLAIDGEGDGVRAVLAMVVLVAALLPLLLLLLTGAGVGLCTSCSMADKDMHAVSAVSGKTAAATTAITTAGLRG